MLNSQPEQRIVYDTVEHEIVPIPIEYLMVDQRLRIYPEVIGQRYFSVSFKGDEAVFQAGSAIGLIPINDRVSINVRPRVPVKNLERIFRIAERIPITLPRFIRKYEPHPESTPSLLNILAQALIGAIDEIGALGLHRQYFQSEADTSFPRGKILVGRTVARHLARGVTHRVTASWFERSIDNPINRCLKYAIWYLSRRYQAIVGREGSRPILSELNRVYRLFEGIELDLSLRFLRDELILYPDRIPSHRAYYSPGIHLALVIIRDEGITFDGRADRLVMASLLWKMDEVVESYLREVLRVGMTSNPAVQVLDGNKQGPGGAKKLLFDAPPSESATPDIVIRHAPKSKPETNLIVSDVKYKKYKATADRTDLDQIIAYGVSYRAPNILLVHPRIHPRHHGLFAVGRMRNMTIYQYAFDFGCDDLTQEERQFVQSLNALAASTVTV